MATFTLPSNSRIGLGKDWMKHTLSWADDAKHQVDLAYRPVHDFTLSNDIAYIKPKARVY
jgi:succinate dehydrogenase / fumarate reductase flavoprotein subunit